MNIGPHSTSILEDVLVTLDRWTRDTEAAARCMYETGKIIHAAELQAAAQAYRACAELVGQAIVAAAKRGARR